MCNARTIRRNVVELKAAGIVALTLEPVKDMGPGVTHKAIVVRLWLDGKEPPRPRWRWKRPWSLCPSTA